MFFTGWNKKNNMASEEFDNLIKRIALLNADVAKLTAQLSGMDTKIEAYRFEVKNLTKKSKAALKADQENIEEETTNINSGVILPYNGTFK
jgi:uncharacterized coiled-coil DUF342 family protein